MAEFSMTKVKKPMENSVLAEMVADIAVNGQGQIMVLHQKPFTFAIRHIEYDTDSGDILFIGQDGETQNFGMAAPANTRQRLAIVREAALLLIDREQEKIADFKKVPVITAGEKNTKTIH